MGVGVRRELLYGKKQGHVLAVPYLAASQCDTMKKTMIKYEKKKVYKQ